MTKLIPGLKVVGHTERLYLIIGEIIKVSETEVQILWEGCVKETYSQKELEKIPQQSLL